MNNGNGKSPQVVDYMARDYDSFLRAMRDQIPRKLPEWKDYESEADFGNVLLELFAHILDISSYYQDRAVAESFLHTARDRRSIIDHLSLIGYRLATAAPASADLTIQFPAAFNGTVLLRKGDAFATKSTKEKPSSRFEYVGENRSIDCSTLPVDPGVGRKLFVISVEEGTRIVDDDIGESDGTDDQRFALGNTELILRSIGASGEVNKDIAIRTVLGLNIDTDWQLQESMAFSRQGQKDYTIEIDENDQATIVFGNRQFGFVPPAGSRIIAEYRVGGGTKGNVPAASIETIVGSPALALAGATVTNNRAATGGADRETIEHAVLHAPQVFRSGTRAVTSRDYEALASNFKGVGKVRAEKGSWNNVLLYVAPEGGGRLSDLLKANLLAYFEDKRPLSTIIEVEDVTYVKVYVTATVGIASYYSRNELRERVEAEAGGLLAFDNVDFKDIIYLSKFYEAIENIDGVEFVTVTEFRRENVAEPLVQEEGKVELAAHEIPRFPGIAVEDPPEDGEYIRGIRLNIEGGY